MVQPINSDFEEKACARATFSLDTHFLKKKQDVGTNVYPLKYDSINKIQKREISLRETPSIDSFALLEIDDDSDSLEESLSEMSSRFRVLELDESTPNTSEVKVENDGFNQFAMLEYKAVPKRTIV